MRDLKDHGLSKIAHLLRDGTLNDVDDRANSGAEATEADSGEDTPKSRVHLDQQE